MQIGRRVRVTARTIRAGADGLRTPPFVRPGHFYSPITSADDVERALNWPADIPGIDLREREQLSLFGDLLPLFDGVPQRRYRPKNGMYGPAEAAIFQAVVRKFQPTRVVEVGSGFSTATLMDTADVFAPDLKITCVEPYPDRLLALALPEDNLEVIVKPVQDVPLDVFTSLGPSDILFIDSTHVAKAGSDVLWLYLHVLPRLQPGVLVHIHDIFWPFEYPAKWLREGRCWNESYFLQAFLCQNDSWDIELFSSWLWQKHPELVPGALRSENPGAIWLRRK